MLVAFWVFNNITAYRLLSAQCGVPSNHYRHQTTNDFKKLLEQKDGKNTLKVATPILLTISMHIELTRLLKIGPPKAKYDSEKKLCEGCTGADWGDDGENKEAIAADDNKDDDDEDSWKKK